jgi:hypothetical protein
MWLTDHDIIALLPMKAGGAPYMMKFPLNEGGLMKALELLRERKHDVLSPLEAQALYNPPKHPPQVSVSKAQERLYAETTPEQREKAQALLRRLGMIK